MLSNLQISDIVLIDRLQIVWQPGLTALTGETGAGKSILLDSLSLALGARADRALVRSGAAEGRVSASFELAADHPAFALLRDAGLNSSSGELILRRVIKPDGGSRAWINDQPVSQSLLAAVGASLVEIHGQHDERGLLQAAGHRALLDAYGGHAEPLAAVAACYAKWQAAAAACAALTARLEAARADEEYQRHALAELQALAPKTGEETALASARAAMMQGEKLVEILSEARDALYRDSGIDSEIRGLARKLERRSAPESAALLLPVIEALDRAANELDDAGAAFQRAEERLAFDPERLEATESRLFELRRLARKHGVAADDLADITAGLETALAAIDGGEDTLRAHRAAEAEARNTYQQAVERLSAARRAAAQRLDAAVNAELPALKLEAAEFRTRLTERAEGDWDMTGAEHVAFEIRTNPGAAFGPLIKVASGGELARVILALKVVLAGTGSAPTLIFDEVDRGLGGATASAVGERLAQLAAGAQVLLVTHSPQVAGRAAQHFRIEKTRDAEATRTALTPLDAAARVEEVARMLAGAQITDAARAAARALLPAQGVA